MRVAVIGDIGGHVDELRAELARLGVKRDGLLPSDLLVIQVGDLVHRGPASDDVITLVDSYLRNEPHRWIQLVGNHEANYLRFRGPRGCGGGRIAFCGAGGGTDTPWWRPPSAPPTSRSW
jgi:hypothetical protein